MVLLTTSATKTTMAKKKINLDAAFELIEELGLDDLMTAVVKYVVSASGKDADGQLEDLSRASRYLYKQVRDLEERNAALEIENVILAGPALYFCDATKQAKTYTRVGRYFRVYVTPLEERIGFPPGALLARGLEIDPAYPVKIKPSYDKSHTVISIPVFGWQHQTDDDTLKFWGVEHAFEAGKLKQDDRPEHQKIDGRGPATETGDCDL